MRTLWNYRICIGFNLHFYPNRYLVQSSIGLSCKPNSFNFANTSSNDLRPKLRTFIISSDVRFVNSSTVLMPARFRQLYERTDNSNSSMLISSTFSFSSSSFSIITSAFFKNIRSEKGLIKRAGYSFDCQQRR